MKEGCRGEARLLCNLDANIGPGVFFPHRAGDPRRWG